MVLGTCTDCSPTKMVTVKASDWPNKSATETLLIILAYVFNSTIDWLKVHSLQQPSPPNSFGQSHSHLIFYPKSCNEAVITTLVSIGYLNICLVSTTG